MVRFYVPKCAVGVVVSQLHRAFHWFAARRCDLEASQVHLEAPQVLLLVCVVDLLAVALRRLDEVLLLAAAHFYADVLRS